jgi:hypothetical protein
MVEHHPTYRTVPTRSGMCSHPSVKEEGKAAGSSGHSDVQFKVEYAKSGRAVCRERSCKKHVEEGSVRIGKSVPMDIHHDVV